MPALSLASLQARGGRGVGLVKGLAAMLAPVTVDWRPASARTLLAPPAPADKARNAAAFHHLFLHEVLEHGLLDGLDRRSSSAICAGMHHDAFAVADHDVARIDRHPAAADRHVEVDRVMLDQVGRRRAAALIGREGELGDLRRVAEAAVGDDAGGAALPSGA